MPGLNPISRFDEHLARRRLARQMARVEAWLPSADPTSPPIVFFNASTRIHRLSLNGAFGLLAVWGIRAQGRRVLQVVCRAGMDQCPLGTDRRDLSHPPPCSPCTDFSRKLFPESLVLPLLRTEDATLGPPPGAGLDELMDWEADGLPLGQLVLPTLRWVLRRHDLPHEPAIADLYRRYLRSARQVARSFARTLDSVEPRRLVVFNGIMFPEAVAREQSRRAGIPVVTHEVGLRPFSAYFSHEHATFRKTSVDFDRPLSKEENARLDRTLDERSRGHFSMAGIRFWPAIDPLPAKLRSRMEGDGRAVVVFTNVVFDTSQVHAHSLYPSMFGWLEDVRTAIERHPERLFVVRAHPDEDRPGKESRQSVAAWVKESGLGRLPNVVFIPPQEAVSSYDLIRSAALVLAYNSSVGLEAIIAGLPVLCAGRARYHEVDPGLLPGSREDYRRTLEAYLAAAPVPPPDRAERARRFLDFELHRASLDFSAFLSERRGHPGMVEWRPFDPPSLGRSKDLQVAVGGIVDGSPFILPATPAYAVAETPTV